MEERSLAIFDLDGTITRHDTLVPFIVGFLLRHPERWWRLPLCVAPIVRYLSGGRDRGALKGAIIHLTLGGLTRQHLAAWTSNFTARLLRDGLFAEALECIATHKRNGSHLVLLSASPDIYVPAIAAALGFDECICTEVRWRDDGRLDGALASPNRRGPEKTRIVTSLLTERRPPKSYAYGNSGADLEHMGLVSEGSYVNGSPESLARYPRIRAVRWLKGGKTGP